MNPELKAILGELTDSQLDEVMRHITDLRKVRRSILSAQLEVDAATKRLNEHMKKLKGE